MKLHPIPRRRVLVWLLAGLLLTLAPIALRVYLHSPSRSLPYHDSFAKGSADEWKALGGTWELVKGEMRNNSDQRGAKLLTGSPYWHNYSIEADIALLGINGDTGLAIRSSNEEEGVNAYSGYYAGVRTRDNSLILGRAEHGWLEVHKHIPAPDGIQPFHWYHLKLLAFDCQIAATVTAPTQAAPTSIAINDQDCLQTGRVGLRSFFSGGIWRNVAVRTATHQDLVEMLQGTVGHGDSELRSAAPEEFELQGLRSPLGQQKAKNRSRVNVQSIASLRLNSFAKAKTATVRGVVILIAPRLFVQDSTGGVYIPLPSASPLNVGDEVEVTGEAHPGDFSSTMDHATVEVLWERTPLPPVSVTALQASTGKFDATFIEVQGRLTGKERGPENTLILDLNDGPQSFRAIMNPGRSDYLFNQLKPDSMLRLRGICVIDPAFTNSLTPFVLLLRSNEDLAVLAGPPWWSTGHVIVIIIASLLLTLVALFLYNRAEQWRLRAIVEERGRLAHEMHDTLAQSFAGIGFQLQAIRNGLTDGTTTLHEQLELASNLVRHSHEEARRSIASLRTEELESEDVLSALDLCARRMVEGGLVQVVLEKEGNHRPLPVRIADALFRIGQEAVANAVRHAHPSILTIRLTYSENSVCLQVEDDGAGFLQGNSLLGFGIRGMRRRAQGISAAFQIISKLGKGTRMEITAPLPPRITLTSWPKHLWRYVKEHWINARPTKHTNSHSYRG
jgi:signal transduction histidine kinase